uniref:Uncharacterized protein n=1 Tax=Anopheles dirus TaxID=7168 RepID=A0A182NWJ2_9DIPT
MVHRFEDMPLRQAATGVIIDSDDGSDCRFLGPKPLTQRGFKSPPGLTRHHQGNQGYCTVLLTADLLICNAPA